MASLMLRPFPARIAKANRLVLKYWPVPLGRGLAFRALSRLAAQDGVRLDAVASWGGRFHCDLRDFVSSRIYYFGVWEPNLTALLLSRLAPGDVFVDVGANIGYFSILASRAVGKTGAVVAIEASPRIHAMLVDDLALNEATNVRALNVAISDREGTADIYAGPEDNRGATSLLQQRGGRYEARVRTAPLIGLLEPAELARVRFIKIDVEGVELAVLLDLLAHIDAYPPRMEIIVEVAPDEMREAGVPLDELLARFAAHGYNWYVIENHHDVSAYIDTTIHPPVRGTAVPTRRADIVLSRESKDVLT